MDRWEHTVESLKANATLDEERVLLNGLGSDGWELVSVVIWRDSYTLYYLKRRVVDVGTYRDQAQSGS
jgi:hypothetical protein